MPMLRLLKNLTIPLIRHLRLFLVLILFYLLQVCVAPYLRIGNVTPNLLWLMLSVVITSYSWYDSGMCGAIIGILTEIMCPTVSMLNLVGYFVITILGIPFFMPKSTRALLQAKYSGKTMANTHRYRKTIFCTFITNFIWQTVNCAFVFLTNNTIPPEFIRRAVGNLAYTTAIALVIVPLLWVMLGIKKLPEKDNSGDNYY